MSAALLYSHDYVREKMYQVCWYDTRSTQCPRSRCNTNTLGGVALARVDDARRDSRDATEPRPLYFVA